MLTIIATYSLNTLSFNSVEPLLGYYKTHYFNVYKPNMFQESSYLFKVCFNNCIFMSPPETVFSLHFDDDKYFKESFIIFPKCEKSLITQGGEVELLKKVTRRRLLFSSLLFKLKFSISWMERSCESKYFEPEMLALSIMVLSVGSYNKDAVPPVNVREIERCLRDKSSET